MRAALALIVLAALLGALAGPDHARAEGAAPSWVEPFAALRPAPIDLRDTRAPLEQRIALAEALGEHGPAADAVAALEGALAADPPPPGRLREAIARALARRRGVASSAILAREPIAAVLAAAKRRPPPRPVSRLGAAWLARPHSGPAMVRAFLSETDPATLRAMARKLAARRREPLRADTERALVRALCDRKAAPHAVLALAASGGAPSETTRRALRRALDGAPCPSAAESAPADDPEAAALRVLAALALAAIGDVEAVPALRHALDSPFARVRLAAATALAVLATPSSCAALASHGRVENSALVHSALACRSAERD